MKKLLLIISVAITLFLMITTAHHHLALRLAEERIVPTGTLVEIDGHKMHVYSEGEKNNYPTLVFLAGSGTVAPTYDFKPLYRLLSDQYRIVVVEKPGYGYSQIHEKDREIDTMLGEVRQALELAGENGPYVLLPHSMSGLEAIRWAQKYPGEIEAIIGLDMATPEAYEQMDFSQVRISAFLAQASVMLGIHRLPGVYPLNTLALNETEIEQQKLLMYRNAMNRTYGMEIEAVSGNAMKVKSESPLGIPVLMFTSNSSEIGNFWISSQESFAAANNGQLIELDSGHYLHYWESEKMATSIVEFLEGRFSPARDR